MVPVAKTKPTKHAVSRMKHRGVVRTANAARQATINAYNIGLTYDDAEGSVKSYIGHLYAHNRSLGTAMPNIRIFGQHVYIFSGRRLLTAYPIPEDVREPAIDQFRVKYAKAKKAKVDDYHKRMQYAKKIGCFGDVATETTLQK